MKARTNFVTLLFIFTLFWLTAFPVPARLKLASQKFGLAKISFKHPFLKMEMVGANLIIFPDSVGAYASRALIRRGRLFDDVW